MTNLDTTPDSLFITSPVTGAQIDALMASFGSLGGITTRCSDRFDDGSVKLTIACSGKHGMKTRMNCYEFIVKRNATALDIPIYRA